ncbi:MAG TPA: (Fe-S)-binding protein, partial [Thermopetrobacter sp.]|nr:(Fe-S)-binding protein [Thermopetrobacter sp.]
FVTCLADMMRPRAAAAALRLLRAAGVTVDVPAGQTCCGQPAWNAGADDVAAALVRAMLPLFEPFDAIVVPSASCAGMIMRHWPRALAADGTWRGRAEALAGRTFELCEFLHLREAEPLAGRWRFGPVAFHESCSLRRETGDVEAPRALLRRIPGLRLVEMDDPAACCGFGGLFSVELPEVSVHLADRRIATLEATGAPILTGVDAGCLMHLSGRLSRRGLPHAVFHVAEILAGAVAEGDRGFSGIATRETAASDAGEGA